MRPYPRWLSQWPPLSCWREQWGPAPEPQRGRQHWPCPMRPRRHPRQNRDRAQRIGWKPNEGCELCVDHASECEAHACCCLLRRPESRRGGGASARSVEPRKPSLSRFLEMFAREGSVGPSATGTPTLVLSCLLGPVRCMLLLRGEGRARGAWSGEGDPRGVGRSVPAVSALLAGKRRSVGRLLCALRGTRVGD